MIDRRAGDARFAHRASRESDGFAFGLVPEIALSESGTPGAESFDTFGVGIVMTRASRNLEFVIEQYCSG